VEVQVEHILHHRLLHLNRVHRLVAVEGRQAQVVVRAVEEVGKNIDN
jgi:hypothetical protein